MNDKGLGFGKVIHIHVGKCGGTTLNSCLSSAGIAFTELHGPKAASQLEALLSWGASDLVFLITMRNPISRFISAFRHDQNRTLDESDTSIGSLQRRLWGTLFRSFSNPNALAEGLSSAEVGTRRLARWGLSNESKMHIGLGLSSYISPTLLQKLPPESTFCLHQESLQNDITAVFEALGYPLPNGIPHLNSTRSKTGQSGNHSQATKQVLSPMGMANLQEALQDEFFLIEATKHRFERQGIGAAS